MNENRIYISACPTAELLWTSFKEWRNKWGKLLEAPDINAYRNTHRSRGMVWRWEMGHKEWQTTRRNRYTVSVSAEDMIRGSEPHWIDDPVMCDMTSSIGIDRIGDNRNPKSLSHYPRGNSELLTSYPTPNNGIGIIDVTGEVREELSNQSGRGWMIYL